MTVKVIFIGAGPGDPDLITVKGRKVIEKADVIIYAGSLVNKDVLAPRKENCDVHNSAYLNLEETIDIMAKAIEEDKLVARVHTGDPAIYGAIGEQIRELKKLNIEYEIIPGVSSLFGTASALEAELTIPEVSQSVIITRPAGRTPKKELESIRSFSKHNATMCIFLGISMIDKVVDELLVRCAVATPVPATTLPRSLSTLSPTSRRPTSPSACSRAPWRARRQATPRVTLTTTSRFGSTSPTSMPRP